MVKGGWTCFGRGGIWMVLGQAFGILIPMSTPSLVTTDFAEKWPRVGLRRW